MSLTTLLAEIGACRDCEAEFGHQPRPVVKVASSTRLLICGQAPGRRVHESGLPFDDPSGDRLRAWMGIDRDTFYDHPAIGFAPMAFCYPGTDAHGGDRPAPARCATRWRKPLLEALPKAEFTLLLGRPAHVWALGPSVRPSMDETVRAWRDYLPDVLAAPHPSWRNVAWLKRNPWFEAEIVPWLRARVKALLAA